MTRETNLAEHIADILPDRETSMAESYQRPQEIASHAKEVILEKDAKELARRKYIEKCRLASEQRKINAVKEEAKRLGIPETHAVTVGQITKLAEQEERIKAIEAIEEENDHALHPTVLASKTGSYSTGTIGRAMQLQGASRADIAKLLTSLNINTSIRLSRTDTANLLACLLTCNEAQLIALQNNKKVPVVIKTVIKRLLEDMKLGNIDTVERIWDRVFGKGAMQLDLPAQSTPIEQGILPNVPISREAYVVIRDTIIK